MCSARALAPAFTPPPVEADAAFGKHFFIDITQTKPLPRPMHRTLQIPVRTNAMFLRFLP